MLRFCFKCDKQIETSSGESDDKFEHGQHDSPWQAIVWSTFGNYGSQIYDEFMGSKKLQILICDDCVLKNKHRIVEYEGERRNPLLSCPPKSFENII